MTSTREFVPLAPASHIISSVFIKLHLLHPLLVTLLWGGETTKLVISAREKMDKLVQTHNKEKLLLLKTVEWCWSPVASTHELARIDTLVLGALVTAAPPTTCHGSDLQRHLRWDLSPAGVVAARFREGWSTSPSGQTSCGWTSMIYPSETLA